MVSLDFKLFSTDVKQQLLICLCSSTTALGSYGKRCSCYARVKNPSAENDIFFTCLSNIVKQEVGNQFC